MKIQSKFEINADRHTIELINERTHIEFILSTGDGDMTIFLAAESAKMIGETLIEFYNNGKSNE